MGQAAFLFFYTDYQKPYGIHRVLVDEGRVLETRRIFHASTTLMVRAWRVAPDGQQIVLRLYRDLIWVNLYPNFHSEWRWLKRDTIVYPSAWSPDCRYLLASSDNRFQDIMLIDVLSGTSKMLLEVPDAKRVLDSTLPHQVDFSFHGWYPQSDAIWYAVRHLDARGKTARSELTWYRYPIARGQPLQLSPNDVQDIHSKWDFVRGSIRSGYPKGTPFERGWLHYTADGTVRILRQGIGKTYPPQNSYRYQRRGAGWIEVPNSDEVLDVSADKRWLLLVQIDRNHGRKTFYACEVNSGEKKILYECSNEKAWYRDTLILGRFLESSFLA